MIHNSISRGEFDESCNIKITICTRNNDFSYVRLFYAHITFTVTLHPFFDILLATEIKKMNNIIILCRISYVDSRLCGFVDFIVKRKLTKSAK